MATIELLDERTIDQIAAGEVVERPVNVVKELLENAIDAQASSVTVEIKDGGITFIRITDNGIGIKKAELRRAFLRHSTSKIRQIEDLSQIQSLGFRGEALSSISAVSELEVVTKPDEELVGSRMLMSGGKEGSFEDIGAPNGTTMVIRNLFFNVPARKKFLKSNGAEATAINNLMEKMVMSHPNVAIKYIVNGKVRLHTNGNNRIDQDIYAVYGKEIHSNLLKVDDTKDDLTIKGFLGKPIIARGNRNGEMFFVNGRFIRSKVLSAAVEEAYRSLVMKHKYPFVLLYISLPAHLVDVNVHPTKMEVRFANREQIYHQVYHSLLDVLQHKELITKIRLTTDNKTNQISAKVAEPFETKRIQASSYRENSKGNSSYDSISSTVSNSNIRIKEEASSDLGKKEEDRKLAFMATKIDGIKHEVHKDSPYEVQYKERDPVINRYPVELEAAKNGESSKEKSKDNEETKTNIQFAQASDSVVLENSTYKSSHRSKENHGLFTDTVAYGEQEVFLTPEAKSTWKIVGQVFKTYWIVEWGKSLYIVDQHAAHERILYEHTMKRLESQKPQSQMVSPPVIISLSAMEQGVLEEFMPYFQKLGYQIERFGSRDYSISEIPFDIVGLDAKQLLLDMIDDLSETGTKIKPDTLLHKVATMSCKAAVKGQQKLSKEEAMAILDELMALDNPYHCPHGRPVMFELTESEIAHKIKRIV